MSKIREGLFQHKLHGTYQIVKFIDNVEHIVTKEKGKLVWAPTIITDERKKKMRPISEIEVMNLLAEFRRNEAMA